eukprot:4577977-Pyramimonas_sp.AAC.2
METGGPRLSRQGRRPAPEIQGLGDGLALSLESLGPPVSTTWDTPLRVVPRCSAWLPTAAPLPLGPGAQPWPQASSRASLGERGGHSRGPEGEREAVEVEEGRKIDDDDEDGDDQDHDHDDDQDDIRWEGLAHLKLNGATCPSASIEFRMPVTEESTKTPVLWARA